MMSSKKERWEKGLGFAAEKGCRRIRAVAAEFRVWVWGSG